MDPHGSCCSSGAKPDAGIVVFRMSGQADTRNREVRFDRWWNVRDLGGLPTVDGVETRRGSVFRGASPHYATQADIDRALSLGLRSFVDLRRESLVDWRAETEGVVTVPVNLLGSITGPRLGSMPDVIAAVVDRGRIEVADAVRAVSDLAERGPVMFHCHTGKDRTGILAIVLLSLAGVLEEEIVGDYLASNPGFLEMRATVTQVPGPEFMAAAPEVLRSPGVREVAVRTMEVLETSGGPIAYLESAGLAPGEITRAAALLR